MNSPNPHGSPQSSSLAPQSHAPQIYGQTGHGYPPAYPPQGAAPMGYGHAGQPAPVNIVVQNTMNQGPRGHGLVRVADRKKGMAVILALFFGGLGVHRFYLGQTGMGIVYLLFCWTFIPAFIALVEALILLLMSAREFDLKYNSALA